MKGHQLAALAVIVSMSSAAIAAPLGTYPVQTGAETERFMKGVPTVTLEQPSGAVLVTPLPLDHGGVSLGVAIYNKGQVAANFGVENIHATVSGQEVQVFTREQLEAKAKNRAMWSAIGVAVLAGAAAAAASTANNTNTYRSVTHTPYGTYSHVAVWRDNTPGILGATAATAAGVAGIVGIQNRLEYTLANLANDIVQTTTIDPEASYGGRIVLGKPKGEAPYDIRVSISWNGTEYPFTFRVTQSGKNMPAPFTAAPTVIPAVAAEPVAAQLPTVTPAVATAPAVTTTAPVAASTTTTEPVRPVNKLSPTPAVNAGTPAAPPAPAAMTKTAA